MVLLGGALASGRERHTASEPNEADSSASSIPSDNPRKRCHAAAPILETDQHLSAALQQCTLIWKWPSSISREPQEKATVSEPDLLDPAGRCVSYASLPARSCTAAFAGDRHLRWMRQCLVHHTIPLGEPQKRDK